MEKSKRNVANFISGRVDNYGFSSEHVEAFGRAYLLNHRDGD